MRLSRFDRDGMLNQNSEKCTARRAMPYIATDFEGNVYLWMQISDRFS